MAVKVIEFGKKRRVKCSYCESLLEYEKEDIKTVQTGMNEWGKEIICPACGEKVQISGEVAKQEITYRMRF